MFEISSGGTTSNEFPIAEDIAASIRESDLPTQLAQTIIRAQKEANESKPGGAIDLIERSTNHGVTGAQGVVEDAVNKSGSNQTERPIPRGGGSSDEENTRHDKKASDSGDSMMETIIEMLDPGLRKILGQ